MGLGLSCCPAKRSGKLLDLSSPGPLEEMRDRKQKRLVLENLATASAQSLRPQYRAHSSAHSLRPKSRSLGSAPVNKETTIKKITKKYRLGVNESETLQSSPDAYRKT